MKKSRKIALTLIASACIAASACSSEQKTQRDVYASRDACANDWGSDQCEQDQTGTRTYGPHYYFYGGRPWYFPRGYETPVETRPGQGAYNIKQGLHSPNAVSSFAASRTTRGGFGGSSFFHGGGS
ncbi:MAG TPA: hypothetical protein VK448_10465 [Dissulfurispiraceae bacterium]|nr:hypothetical protein [Dissulfurispiraceae bacterium]